ncbi:4Fe-4S binding protein [Clostridium botulinum]|uniref:(4Fe-4S)-binding protein n=1 Tax=Clostridium botulinum TaxID=1491 RepID=A0A9Q1ZC88_CLOBO|nr:4Fe-4S binding protein [Clostridium botulinum]AEB76684.1 anaerobic sulfite reductase subunit C [Clostridium botulinum BKT015925]KEI00917.1 (4Fe-4S)-binding protein [Clostridium botulinum C/D str. Sp77]KEI04811.1 (4Fe-4S)-binding protein [Clostridium botulinum D str. 16868]KLU76845.1 (4Fe-4S)-binding protein [Clostridium botulinum V891]KOA74214.1 (4Fe-4S)-binding protein [Clostridium botulinum]
MVKLSPKEIAELKGQGYILEKDKEHFVCRVITVNGTMTSEKIKKVADISEKYGEGHMSFTSRLTIEIRGIKYEDIDNVKEELKEGGMYAGGTGKRVRPVTSCKGTVCSYGLLDTQELNRKIHERFYLGWYDVVLPHKFKIAVGGCPNNCIKPNLNDLGIMAQRKPELNLEKCKNCGKCAVIEKCRMKAVYKVEDRVAIDREKCINCGKCIENCYFSAMEVKEEGMKIYLGGRWGKYPKAGYLVDKIFNEEEALDFIEKAILYFKENGIPGERFGIMLDRIGFNKAQEVLLGNDMIERKPEILSK